MDWMKNWFYFVNSRKTAKTLPIEATTSFTTMSLSPNGYLLITGNECKYI